MKTRYRSAMYAKHPQLISPKIRYLMWLLPVLNRLNYSTYVVLARKEKETTVAYIPFKEIYTV